MTNFERQTVFATSTYNHEKINDSFFQENTTDVISD